MYNQSQLIAVPARDKMLKLDIVPTRRNSSRATWRRIRFSPHEDGSPAANAEVSLGIIDEAIYSIQPETAANIKTRVLRKRFDEVQTSLAIHYTFTGYGGENPRAWRRINLPISWRISKTKAVTRADHSPRVQGHGILATRRRHRRDGKATVQFSNCPTI